MIRISQIKCLHENEIEEQILRKLKIRKNDLLAWQIHKRSVDARHQKVLFSYTVDVKVKKEKRFLPLKDVRLTPDESYHEVPEGHEILKERPVVVGFGPAGMFAALLLARRGYRPIVLERGADIDARKKQVQAFWNGSALDPENNVQYGQGGAGAFSDGKLTTRSKDPRCRKVLEELVEHGADPDILIDAHPHIGTDGFVPILKNIQKTIEDLGGTVYYHTRLLDLVIENGRLKAVETDRGTFPCTQLFLCIGHSARDTLLMCHKRGIPMENKAFAVGVRIEHLQADMNEALLHERASDPRFVPARYQLAMTASNKKGVYTFCMCPGGIVINASSQPGHLVINGMSYTARDQVNANSALLVQVNESDYGKELFAGLHYQEELEQKAFACAGSYKAPVQQSKDYLQGQLSHSFDKVFPSYTGQTVFADLNSLFTPAVNLAMHEGLVDFETKIPGFKDGLMTGVESRSSSAVRIVRNASLQSAIEGIYPCGEGSGYAGGIMTSAIDGLRCAEKMIERFQKPL